MTKPKRPLRLDVHITLNDEQMEKILDAFDQLGEVINQRKVKQ